jgi:hypothetical protein
VATEKNQASFKPQLAFTSIWEKIKFVPMSPFRSNMTGNSLAISGVGTWLQSGRMRASFVVLESTETHKFSDATYVWKKSKYTCANS